MTEKYSKKLQKYKQTRENIDKFFEMSGIKKKPAMTIKDYDKKMTIKDYDKKIMRIIRFW